MTEPVSPAHTQKYRFVQYGGGVEELDRFAIRERIRSGDIAEHSELSLVGSEDWKPASSYPELARYFELAAARPKTLSTTYAPAKQREVRPMSERVIQGLAYPLIGGQAVSILLLAVFSVLPFGGFLATLASTVIMLGIIRSSADGKLKMPPLVDTSNLPEMIRRYFQVLFVTLVSLAVPLVITGYAIRLALAKSIGLPTLLFIALAAVALAAIYYPACLATVAVWDNALAAISPFYIFKVIRIMGSDYFVVIAMWFVATVLTGAMTSPIFSPLKFIPFVGPMVEAALSFWVLFYASHLLGYAAYRHAPELGWD